MRYRILFILPLLLLSTTAAQQPDQLREAQQSFEHAEYRESSAQFREILSSEPDNVEALSGLVDSMEAIGEWKEVIGVLEHLVSLQPSSARRLNQLGRWESWSGKTEGLQHLRLACRLEPSHLQFCEDYAEVLSWDEGKRGYAISELRAILSTSPDFLPAITQLAEILSWDKKTRLESSHLYDRALQLKPNDSRSLAGKAQLLAYSGRTTEAMDIYRRVLDQNPNDASALAGEAQLLNWTGDYARAEALLVRAQSLAPNDRHISTEMARAQLGLHNYSDARRVLDSLSPGKDLENVQQELDRNTSPWLEIGTGFRRNPNNLTYTQGTVTASETLGTRSRLMLYYTPTLYSDSEANYNANDYGGQIDGYLSDRVTFSLSAASQVFQGISPEVTGGIQGHYQGHSLQLNFGFDRAAVDDTLLSLRGNKTVSGLTGQVTSNLISGGVGFRNRSHGLDGSISSSTGLYTGSNLDNNRRWGVDGNLGKQVLATPYLRLQYGVSYTEFQYDARATASLPRQFGGYFSPTRYLMNYAGVTFSRSFNSHIELQAAGTAGAQNVESSTSRFGDESFAGSFMGNLLFRPSPRDEIRIRYEYLDVFNAFHRHSPSVSWRHYF